LLISREFPWILIKRRFSQKRAVSELIVTLLLIVISIATSVIVYAYVMGFTGESEMGSPPIQRLITVSEFCASTYYQCNSNGYSVVIRNIGASAIPASNLSFYMTDLASGKSAMTDCQLSSSLQPGSTVTCPSGSGVPLPSALYGSPGDDIQLRVVTSDGGQTDLSSRILAVSTYYVPITITNSQSSSTQDDLQQLINIDFSNYANYLAKDVGNIRFYNSTNFSVNNELPAWLENYTGGTGSASSSTSSSVWLSLVGTIIPASSSGTVYMVFEPVATEFDGVYWGEAPQLSTTYGQYDNGARVFLYYDVAPTGTSGWTIHNVAGITAAAPTGSYFHSQDAFYANSANGDYLYTQVPGLNANEIITFWTYTTGLGNFYFLANLAGKGQMARLDSRGGGDWSGLATTTAWTSWSAPSSGLHESASTWYKYDVVINGNSATAYIGANTNNLGTLGTPANTLSIVNNGNYLGIIGDALGSTHISYWNGLIIRLLPPNGISPTVGFGALA
jgi:hypothetical protein